MAFRLTRNHWR